MSDTEHFFLYLLAICMSFLERNNVYLGPLPIFKFKYYFFNTELKKFLCLLDINSLSDI